jgi:hypothetical protein
MSDRPERCRFADDAAAGPINRTTLEAVNETVVKLNVPAQPPSAFEAFDCTIVSSP